MPTTPGHRKARRSPLTLLVLLLLGILAMWQFWSWGPYTVQLTELDVSTQDFVIECSYGAAGLHGVHRVYAEVHIVAPNERITCPRRFLGPTGTGMHAIVIHPLHTWASAHKSDKFDQEPALLAPVHIDAKLAQLTSDHERRYAIRQHISALEYKYLRQFEPTHRLTLADAYVETLQQSVLVSGSPYIENGQQGARPLASIDKLFRRP